jgi:acetoin utilization protein AcuB
MFVEKSMAKQVVTIGRDTGILEARKLMDDHKIRHLPVVETDGTLVGIVTDRDIRSAMPSLLQENFNSTAERERLSRLTAQDIMTPEPLAVRPNHTIQDVLLLIQEKKVGALPVTDENGKIRGIISVRDLMRAFINVLGIGQPGILLGILVEDKLGQLKKIVDAISEEKIGFGSVLVARHWDESKRAVFPYLLTSNVSPIKKKLKAMGYTLLDPLEWNLDHMPGEKK